MSTKFRIALLLAMIAAILFPFSAQAAGVFYCSTLRATGGSGTYADPWACATQDQVNNVVNVICTAGGGWLYQIYADSYVYYRIQWVNNQCAITYQQRYYGYPPNTGVDLPMPLLVGLGVAAGGLLIVGGLVLRKRAAAQ